MPIKNQQTDQIFCTKISSPVNLSSHDTARVTVDCESVEQLTSSYTGDQNLSSHETAGCTFYQSNPVPAHLPSHDTAGRTGSDLIHHDQNLSSHETAGSTLHQSDPVHLSSQDTAGRLGLDLLLGDHQATAGSVPGVSAEGLWDLHTQPSTSSRALTRHGKAPNKPITISAKQSKLCRSDKMSPQIAAELPFANSDICLDLPAPAKPVVKTNHLKDMYFTLPTGAVFRDKVLPRPEADLVKHSEFDVKYYLKLHEQAAAPGARGQYSWPKNTPNYIGARVPLLHTNFNLDRWRLHLIGYHSPEILQFMEYGFPLGIDHQVPTLTPALANHGSAYQFYPWLDKFFTTGLLRGGVTGPCGTVPFGEAMISPLMTAEKKPSSRRAVFDATYGQHSLNNATPCEYYLGVKTEYTYPKIEDFRNIILKCGVGSWLWKRDLARYFLQLPLDPTEYCFTGAIWRGLYFFFVSLMFGLRHSGLQGQKLTDAVCWIHRNMGLDYVPPQARSTPAQPAGPADPALVGMSAAAHNKVKDVRHKAIIPVVEPYRQTPFQSLNYSDDLGGGERTFEKATAAFNTMGALLSELGLEESADKACAPAQRMTYLGVHFDTVKMTMSVPGDKLQEIRAELELWKRKTTSDRKGLQSILGKLFWISRVVVYSRPFMGRLLQQLRDMKDVKAGAKVPLSMESKKDILWWMTYLRTFNGVSVIINDHDTHQTLEQLITSPYKVCAGDATLWGGGAWYGKQFWSREFPDFLKPSDIAVHIKEFWTLICSCWVWGDNWVNDVVYLFCDNDSVVDTIVNQKPRDPDMNTLLREFLYVVCLKKFSPILRKIDTKANFLADHISRRHDTSSADQLFTSNGKPGMVRVSVPDTRFKLSAPW